MDKLLYIEIENKLKKYHELKFLSNELKSFLYAHEEYFKKEESILALKKIRIYYEEITKTSLTIKREYLELNKKHESTCDHEIAFRSAHSCFYNCLICSQQFGENIPLKPLLVIDCYREYDASDLIGKIFKEIIYSDKDIENLIELVSEKIEELQYEKDIKVYRRTR